MISPNYTLYDNSLGIALVLMLFFAFYFLLAKTPDKRIFSNYLMSRRLMAGALLALSANYSVHLFVAPRFLWKEAAIMMNLSTYYLTYWLFNCAFMVLLKPHYFTVRRFLMHIAGWLAYVLLSIVLLLGVSKGTMQHAAIALMALWLIAYGICLSRNIILTYRRAVRLFDDMHSEDIGTYIHWMSIFTWWALIYGVGCGLLTFLPDRFVFLWILSSIPFYIYLYCSYLNYLLFYEQVECILEKEMMEKTSQTLNCNEHDDALLPTYHATIKERLDKWITADGYTRQGLTIEELAATLVTNRTYLSSYIKMVYHVSFREWIAELRIAYAKQQLVQHPELTAAAISEASGFLSLSYFTKIFTTKEGCPPSKWRKRAIANG